MQNKCKRTIRFRLLNIFFLVTFIPMLIMAIIYYGATYKDCKAMLQEELLHLANGAAVIIDPSHLKHAEIEKFKDNHTYQTLNKFLCTYKTQVNATYLYILKKDMNTAHFLLDGEEIGEESKAYIGEKYDLNQYMDKAFNGKAAVTDTPYSDRWGTFLTGYAPIFNTDGKVYGIVGLDINASKLETIQKKLFFHIAMIFIACSIISFLSANYLTKKDAEQISKIQVALLKAGERDFSVCKVDEKDWLETRLVINSFNKTMGKIKMLMDKSQEANRLKSEFMSTMSHELRTPLNSIIGYTTLVLNQAKDTLSPKHKKHLQTVERNGQHLLKLINQMLDLSAIEANKKNLTLKKFNCIHLIDEVIELTLPLAHQKNLTLKDISAEKEIMVCSDRKKLLQILINLTGNAIKFTEKGEIKLKTESVILEDGTHHINIIVADTGIGIRQEDIQTIFEPFRQIDGSLTRQKEGTGLGLHLTQNLCHLLKGEITVKSKVNEGTTFCCSFPSGLEL